MIATNPPRWARSRDRVASALGAPSRSAHPAVSTAGVARCAVARAGPVRRRLLAPVLRATATIDVALLLIRALPRPVMYPAWRESPLFDGLWGGSGPKSLQVCPHGAGRPWSGHGALS